jgi:hypothetical protein
MMIWLELAPAGDTGTLRNLLKRKGIELGQPVGPASFAIDPRSVYERMKATSAGVCLDAGGTLPGKLLVASVDT